MHHEPTGASDQDLAARILNQGDERAFRTLYQRHTPYLYQFALRTLGGDEQEAEDVVQETWIRGVERLGTFRWDAGLRTWLVAIALNVCRGLFRRKDAGWLELADETMEGRTAVSPDTKIDLEQALAQLPAGYRTVVLLHDLEGYRHEEIARELGTTVGTSKSQLFHGRRALRRLLGSERQSEASAS
jgi:RNA polymerase sigma-70 factor (ECF subfamily)